MAASPRILILEDVPDDADLIVRVLLRGGISGDVRRVEGRDPFCAALREFQPEVVLTDYNVPGFSGLEALEAAKVDAPGTPVIFVSGSIGEEAAVDTLRRGALDYVLKDRLGRLPDAVRRAMAAAAEQRARGQVETDLRASENRYRTLIESARDCIIALDPQGTITALNAAFEAITGWPRREWIERSFTPLIHPDDLPAAQAALARCLAGEAPPLLALRIRVQPGGHRWAECTLAPVAENGRIVAVLVIGRDITDRRLLEQQFHQAQKMEAVGRLAGGVAHDFNNLLTVINGYSQLMMMRLPPGHPDRSQIEEIRQAGERAAGLTRRLLLFSRKQPVEVRPLDLNALIADFEKMLRRLIGEDIHLVVRPGPGLGRIDADPGQMEQVIMNLAVNARDAMPDGGTLTIATENVEASPSATFPAGPAVQLSVSDTGCGMAEDVLAHLFEPFFTTKEAGRGTGLGLTTTYGIVRHFNGAIDVESRPGAGTTFRVRLPRVGEGDRSVAPDDDAAEPPPPPAGAILLAEDDDAVRVLAAAVLRGAGWTVLEARDGPEALALLQRHGRPVDLLLTDTVMPRTDLDEFTERILAQSPGLRVLHMSGYGDAGPGAAGAFLAKPFTPRELLAAVNEAVKKT